MRYLISGLCFLFMLVVIPCFAANSVISFTEQLTADNDNFTRFQTEAANPLLTIKIADNNSHTITLSSVQTSVMTPIKFISLRFNGTGTGCIVRFMATNNKSLYVAYPVAAGGVLGMGMHPNTKFVNYSGAFN